MEAQIIFLLAILSGDVPWIDWDPLPEIVEVAQFFVSHWYLFIGTAGTIFILYQFLKRMMSKNGL